MAIRENRPLPAHNPDCLGCGPDNPAALHLEVTRVGDEVVSMVRFDHRHTGGPGLAHGGALATACDDLFGFVLYVAAVPGVTRSLQVEYLAPVVLDRPYRITARLDRRDGRKLYMSAEGVTGDGTLAFSATALFLVVGLSHFQRFGSVERSPGLASLRSEHD